MDYGRPLNKKPQPEGITLELTKDTNFGKKGEVKEIEYYIAVHLLEKGYAVVPSAPVSLPLIPVAPLSSAARLPFKTIALVTTLNNGAGLQKDADILKSLLESYGYTVYLGGACGPFFNFRPVDLVIFLELVCEQWFRYGKHFWLMPNSEWFWPQWEQFLPRMSRILCKTHHCYALWSQKVGAARCTYTGFEAIDFYIPEILKQKKFLHLAGKSSFKNTEAVVEAWRSRAVEYPLTIVGGCPVVKEHAHKISGQPRVTYIERCSDLHVLLNEHLFHIIPSQMEGYGHAMHEGLGCKSVVITSNVAPMREFAGIPQDLLVPTSGTKPHCLSLLHFVTPAAVATACHKVWSLTEDEITKISEDARAGFLADRDDFHNRFSAVFNA